MIKVNDLNEYVKNEVDTLANAVRSTLGPCGSNVIINDGFNTKITKDGVSVARAIKKERNSPIIDIIQQVAEKTGNEAGDGTTSSTIFAQALIHSIYKNIEPSTNLLDVKKELDELKELALELLKNKSRDVEDLYNIAKVSSNNDEEISKLAVEIADKTGIEGMVDLKESDSSSTYVKYTEGLKWNGGYLSPSFVTNSIKMECVLSNVRVEIYEQKLTSLKPLVKIMDTCVTHDIPLLLAVKDIEYDVLNTLIYNQVSGKIKVCVVKIPGHGEYRQDYINDLKAVIGNNELIDKVVVTKHNTLFINNQGNEQTKADRIAHLRHRMTLPDQNLQDLQARITNINNGYATVYVGGDSSIEIKEKIDRFEDAICAVKSAMEEGVVVGGGNTLWEISKELPNNSIACKAMIQACSAIREQLHANYLGIDNYEYGTLNLPDYFIGYKNGEVCNLTSDIIDPTKVIRLIIENGVSIAGTLITTKCLIINENDYERKF